MHVVACSIGFTARNPVDRVRADPVVVGSYSRVGADDEERAGDPVRQDGDVDEQLEDAAHED